MAFIEFFYQWLMVKRHKPTAIPKRTVVSIISLDAVEDVRWSLLLLDDSEENGWVIVSVDVVVNGWVMVLVEVVDSGWVIVLVLILVVRGVE